MKRTTTILFFASIILGSVLSPHVSQAQKQAIGPILKIFTDPFDFDTIISRTKKCIQITFRNDGDTAGVVRRYDFLRPPFYAYIDTPITVDPGKSKTFDLCYMPFVCYRDSQRVKFFLDSRVPLSIGMVFDVSSSMFLKMPDGKQRIQGAHDAGVDFVDHLLDTLGIQDEAAVFTFDDHPNYAVKQAWTTNKTLLKNAMPAVALGTSTCIYDALLRTLQNIRNRVKKKMIVILTDGEDSGPSCGTATIQKVIDTANYYNVRIYAITVGNLNTQPLGQIASKTNGELYNATTALDLLSVYRRIATRMSQNVDVDVTLKGASVGPKIELNPNTFKFDSIRIGYTQCLPLQIKNTGNATLFADTLRNLFILPFHLENIARTEIVPGQFTTAELCFTPTLPTDYTQKYFFRATPCNSYFDSVMITAPGYLLPRSETKQPVLTFDKPLVDFDTTFCKTTECIPITFENTGDTVMTVYSVDTIRPPFNGSIPAPFTIPAKDKRQFVICYTPSTAPVLDSQRIFFRADARVALSCALLFDKSSAMKKDLAPGLPADVASSAAMSDLISGLLNPNKYNDEVGLFAYSSVAGYRKVLDYATDHPRLIDSIPRAGSDTVSCVYSALGKTLEDVAKRTKRPVIVLVAKGHDDGPGLCGLATADSVVTQALRSGTVIHTLNLGSADSLAFKYIAQSTGGGYYAPATLIDMILNCRSIEASLSRNVQSSFLLKAQGVTPIIAITPDTLDFLTVETKTKKCLPVTIDNTGNAPLSVSAIMNVRPPFSIEGDIVREILPGTQRIINVCFTPQTSEGFQDSMLVLHNSCIQNGIPLYMKGMGFSVDTINVVDWKSPITRVTGAPNILFDTTFCNTTKCRTYEFTNDGDTSSTVHFPKQLNPPFSATQDSLVIPPGGKGSWNVCYNPKTSPAFDSLLVKYTADIRESLSLAIGMNLDSSLNTKRFVEGTTYAQATSYSYINLIKHMLSKNGIQDEVAWYGLEVIYLPDWKQHVFYTSQDYFSTDKDSLIRRLPMFFPLHGNRSCVNELASTILDELKDSKKSPALIIFADREDECAKVPADTVITKAALLHSPIFFIALGSTPLPTLMQIALATGGAYFQSPTPKDMDEAVRQIPLLLSKDKERTVLLTGQSVAPVMTVQPDSLNFGTLRIGEKKCLPITIRNTGNAPLEISDFKNPFTTVDTTTFKPIPPGGEAVVQICFEASKLQTKSGNISLSYKGCDITTLTVSASGSGWDSIVVMLVDTIRGKPGSNVTIPVRLYGTVPSEYDIRSVSFAMRYNKSMLYPLDVPIAREQTLTQSFLTNTYNTIFDNSTATLQVKLSGDIPLTNSGGTAPLVNLRYLVLRGDAMQTPLELISASVDNENVHVGIVQPGLFIADSLCFQADRLITTNPHTGNQLRQNIPNPFNPLTAIGYRIAEASEVTLTVYDVFGREVQVLVRGSRDTGEYSAVFDATRFASGLYFARLHVQPHAKGSADFEGTIKMFSIK